MTVRKDLRRAHDAAWHHVTGPGSWWDGAQRREVAAIALDALDGRDHAPTAHVPAEVGAASVRLATDAASATESWYRDVAAVIGELPYVELVGVVTTTAAVATFARAAGLARAPLPDARSGEPTGARPDEVVDARLNWVPVAAPADQTAAVVQAYSAVPGEMANLWSMASAQYMPEDEMGDARWTRGTLSRPQMELVATKVAQGRGCFF